MPIPVLDAVRRRLRPLQLRRRLLLGPGSHRPVSRAWGYERGTPIDRIYIERFLAECAADVRGVVLEVGDPAYTRRFGGDRVTSAEVLHAVEGNPEATFVGDLESGAGIPTGRYDCVILTEVLPTIFDLPAAIGHLHAALAPGGVALVTVGGLIPIDREGRRLWHDYWRFTDAVVERLLGDVFGPEAIEVRAHGNVRTAAAGLYGLAAEDLRPRDFDHDDEDFQMTIVARAQKAGAITPAAGGAR